MKEMFHVEHILDRWFRDRGLVADAMVREKLLAYAGMVHSESRKFNLTGLKNHDEIVQTLVLGSIGPALYLDVPRGTRFVDIGSGAGVPGIPLGVFFPETAGVLVEANAKKAAFMSRAVTELGIDNLRVVHGRVEELCRLSEYRESFNWGFSRAFGSVFEVIEMGLPLVAPGGYFFIYSRLAPDGLDPAVPAHAERLGARFIERRPENPSGEGPGLLLHKMGLCDRKYPRKYPAIRRDAGKTVVSGE